MSTSAPPPAPLSAQRTIRPWYLILAMVSSWLVGVRGLSDSFSTLLFLRENNLPDIQPLVRGLSESSEPLEALGYLLNAAHMRALGEAAKVAFPLTVGKLILSVLLVITSAMAMSGRPGSRMLAIQAHLAYAALASATFWLLRETRYAVVDVMGSVHHLLPKLLASEPPQTVQLMSAMLSKSAMLWLSRVSFALFGVGALVLGALALMTTRTKAFFDAVAAATEDAEEP
ncbi:MAG: hypothetical protein IPM54_17540 [Polyangiaceae bacterium]|nr:hypothetical protein [Polyangiaceae bacterium]